ncbi:MAG TPA: alpha/beta hydrolase [Mycobacteriales bacterium]|nr:alpha/beta hydrolase [Mycobacteriales bacterium]
MKRLSVTVAVVAAITAATSSLPVGAETNGHASTSAGTRSLSFGSCDGFNVYDSRARCGFLVVPLDYAHPNGPTIKLAVSEVPHTSSAADYQGAILVNPGGPGGSGLALSSLGRAVPNGVGGDYDWIGFDPRGVGQSKPALHCLRHYFHFDRPDYRPRTAHLMQVWKDRSRHYADACAEKHPNLIQHLTTADSARDMDALRQALGQRQISFYGFSYGTYLGQVYASMFPSHLRRMVLDSSVDPRRVWYAANLDQDRAFNRNSNIWFHWLAKYHSHFHLGQTTKAVRERWYAALNTLAAHPAGGKLGPAEWTDAYLYAGYYRSTWVSLGNAFSRYVHGGHWRPTANFYSSSTDRSDDNSYAGYLGVECTDAHWPAHWSRWRDDSRRVAAKAPFMTWDNTWFNAPCHWWHAPARTPVTIDGSHVRSALLIDETLDAATPFAGSLEVRRLFPNSSLIAEPGGATHADTLSGDGCVDNRIARYLATGHRPPRASGDGPDYLCKPLPDPVPTG